MTTLETPNFALPLAAWPARASRAYRRCFDLAIASLALAVSALPMLLIALAVKLCDGGPVFYSQRRMTLRGAAFRIWKFRTMIPNAEPDGPVFSKSNDARGTRIGKWLRRWGLDELPQLLNVLAGDMAIIGPRPERPEFLEQLTREIPDYPLRLRAKAGITGWAQVHGLRGDTSFRKRVKMDLYYIRHWSPLLDLRILLATPLALLKK